MTKNTQTTPIYNSNPFTLSFSSFGKLLAKNVSWVVALVGIELLYWIGQAFSALINAISSDPRYTSYGPEYSTQSSALTNTPAASAPEIVAMVIFGLIFVLFVLVVFAAISIVMMSIHAAYAFVALESQKGKTVSFVEAIKAVASRFWRLLGASILATLKIVGGLFLFVIPGIRAALRYSQLTYTIMAEPAEKKGIIESHNRTKQLVKGRLMEIFGIETIAAFIPFIGKSLSYAGQAALYTQLAHYTDKKLQKPGVHWLNYIGLILLAVFVLFAISIVALVFALSQAS